MSTKLKARGFTIVEMMIVLAIAGVIMLLVFLAVPALQRNSRNTAYRNEASALLGAITEFSTNHSGDLPTSSASHAVEILAAANTKNITTLTVRTGAAAAVQTTPSLSQAYVGTGVKCPTPAVTGTSVTPQTAATRSVVLIYAIEDSAGNATAICTAS
jgi:prepilin-type N-terminal cleavage/methylation domain-containing protein